MSESSIKNKRELEESEEDSDDTSDFFSEEPTKKEKAAARKKKSRSSSSEERKSQSRASNAANKALVRSLEVTGESELRLARQKDRSSKGIWLELDYGWNLPAAVCLCGSDNCRGYI